MKELQEQWEQGGKFVAEFKHDGAVYRIIQFDDGYNLQRYFSIAGVPQVSVDYEKLDAHTTMFALGEIIQYGNVGAK